MQASDRFGPVLVGSLDAYRIVPGPGEPVRGDGIAVLGPGFDVAVRSDAHGRRAVAEVPGFPAVGGRWQRCTGTSARGTSAGCRSTITAARQSASACTSAAITGARDFRSGPSDLLPERDASSTVAATPPAWRMPGRSCPPKVSVARTPPARQSLAPPFREGWLIHRRRCFPAPCGRVNRASLFPRPAAARFR